MRPLLQMSGRIAAAALRIAATVFTLLVAPPADAQTADAMRVAPPSIATTVAEASQRFGIPRDWIYAVMGVESAGDPDATSIKGAIGLMQVMPATYAGLRARYALGPNAYDPRDNILAGAAYLREMYDRYGAPGFLAAYNAGPGRYEDYLSGRPLPAETRAYLMRLQPRISGPAATPAWTLPDPLAWTRAALFAAGRDTHSLAAEPATAASSTGSAPMLEKPVAAPVQRPLASLFVVLSGPRR